MHKRLCAIVKGDVQGVSFRRFTIEHARRLSLSGFAKNLDDGSVEIVAEGPEQSLMALLEQIKKGPERAAVQGLSYTIQKAEGAFKGFDRL